MVGQEHNKNSSNLQSHVQYVMFVRATGNAVIKKDAQRKAIRQNSSKSVSGVVFAWRWEGSNTAEHSGSDGLLE